MNHSHLDGHDDEGLSAQVRAMGRRQRHQAAYFALRRLQAVRSEGVDRAEVDDISDRLYDLAEEDPAIGTASLVAAISLFFECSVTGSDVESTLEILSSCYEAVLHTEGLAQEALESNRDNENCSRFIDFQWEAIVRAASSE
ncbi:hypothetical protein [Streptomyces spiralis]|uniref:hypothetical protein n=1 Tax=Streptomyces spiralis TaxID=66376 RepID=UPI0036CC57B7